jgi:hypothetical protein
MTMVVIFAGRDKIGLHSPDDKSANFQSDLESQS